MSKVQAFNWGKVALISTVIVAGPIVGAWVGDGVDIVRVPEREARLESRVNDLSTNSAEQFREINWKLNKITDLITNWR